MTAADPTPYGLIFEDCPEIEPKPHPPDDFARGARFGMAYVRGAGGARGTLSPILDVAKIADRRGYDRGFADALEAAQQVLEQVAEERGTTSYAVLAEVRERIARRADGLRTGRDVVRGRTEMGALCVRHTEQAADDLGGANPVGSSICDLKARAASRAWSPVRKRNSGAPSSAASSNGAEPSLRSHGLGRLRRRSAPRARRSRTTHRRAHRRSSRNHTRRLRATHGGPIQLRLEGIYMNTVKIGGAP